MLKVQVPILFTNKENQRTLIRIEKSERSIRRMRNKECKCLPKDPPFTCLKITTESEELLLRWLISVMEEFCSTRESNWRMGISSTNWSIIIMWMISTTDSTMLLRLVMTMWIWDTPIFLTRKLSGVMLLLCTLRGLDITYMNMRSLQLYRKIWIKRRFMKETWKIRVNRLPRQPRKELRILSIQILLLLSMVRNMG